LSCLVVVVVVIIVVLGAEKRIHWGMASDEEMDENYAGESTRELCVRARVCVRERERERETEITRARMAPG